MATREDPVNFEILEGQKENIQSLPGGRSARKLAQLYSPNSLRPLATPNPADTEDAHAAERAVFEEEVANIAESDDPLDVYDRYVRWTLESYPSAQATPTSQLDILLERATKAFVSSSQYQNDPRYLKMWIYYIQFFSEAPRETFLFLSRHGIGESLALFYEEYAAWLEGRGRWAQAEEVYKLGIEREARPQTRLLRKFKEFEHRMSEQPEENTRPSSPAIPPVRTALAAKIDPFAASMRGPVDPQALLAPVGLVSGTSAKKSKGKMTIFSDADAKEPVMAERQAVGAKGWDLIGSRAESKKENAMEARPWTGETLQAGGKKPTGPKMAIFRDASQKSKYSHSKRIAQPQPPSHAVFDQLSQYKISSASDQVVMNPRTGKLERIYVDLEVVYPEPDVRNAELSFEEVWAWNRGWFDREWDEEDSIMIENEEPSYVDSNSRYEDSLLAVAKEEEMLRKKLEQQPPAGKQMLQIYNDVGSSENTPKPTQKTKLAIHPDSSASASQRTKMAIHRDRANSGSPSSIIPQKQKLSIHRDEGPVLCKKQKLSIHHDPDFGDENGFAATGQSPTPPVQKIPIHRDDMENLPVDENGNLIQKSVKQKNKKKNMDFNETQIIKAKLDSPSQPKIMPRRKSMAAESTMTIHTKSATDDIYDIFNAPLPGKKATGSDDDYDSDEYMDDESKGEDEEEEEEDDDDDDDDDDVKSDWSDITRKAESALNNFAGTTHLDFTVRGVIDDDEEEEEEESNSDDSSEAGCSGEEEEVEVEEMVEDEGATELGTASEANQSSIYTEQESSLQPGESETLSLTPLATKEPTPEKSVKQKYTITHTEFIPVPPEDYVPPTRPYRDPETVANNRLPFMTPITERTEMSLDFQQTQGKTPSRSKDMQSMIEEDEDEDEDEEDINPNELMSSPLIDMGKSPLSYSTNISQPTFSPKSASKALASKGPIIKKLQVNPMDNAIRKEILDSVRPALGTYVGFYDHQNENYDRGNEIRRFARAMSKAKSTGEQLTGPVIRLRDAHGEYTVKKELGAGAFAPVYLVENSAPHAGEKDEVVILLGPKAPRSRYRSHLEALKMETPPSTWEFFIMRLVHSRLGLHNRAAASLTYAHELHLYRDEGFLVLLYHPHGTLLDVVNYFRAEPSGVMDEQLAMFFSIELLRTIEALHSKGVMHGDLKADNCLLRIDSTTSAVASSILEVFTEKETLDPRYHADGRGGWASRGVTLIDFGRGIDMRAFDTDKVGFIADWKTTSMDCAEMREGRPWTWHIDYHGLAGIIHTLLFGKYIETVCAEGPTLNGALNIGVAGRKYRVRENLKRYWQTDIWADCFDLLLNPEHFAQTDGENGKMPVTKGLARVRGKMEVWLEMNCEKGTGLRNLMKKVEVNARSGKR